jgi:hypothetical protein
VRAISGRRRKAGLILTALSPAPLRAFESGRLKAPWRSKLPGALQDAPPVLECGGKARPVLGSGRHAAFSQAARSGPTGRDGKMDSASRRDTSNRVCPHPPAALRDAGSLGTRDRWLRSCLVHHRLIASSPPAWASGLGSAPPPCAPCPPCEHSRGNAGKPGSSSRRCHPLRYRLPKTSLRRRPLPFCFVPRFGDPCRR